MSQQKKDQNQLASHTLQFAKAVRDFGKVIPMTVSNVEDLKQLIRASGAVGAYYTGAMSARNRQEYFNYIQNCGKEAKATHYWLQLIDTQGAATLEHQRSKLLTVAHELGSIFSKILQTASV